MPKQTLQFGEWRPDIALLDNQFANVADNVFATINSYQPIPSLVPFTNAQLPAPCKGLTSARLADGNWAIYAGTATKLYRFTNFSGWTDVSRISGGNYNCPFDELWSFSQFGPNLTALNINDKIQTINVDTGSNFADLIATAGTVPQAHNSRVIGDFLVLGGLSTNRFEIAWSAINDITGWAPATNLSGQQIMPDGGLVMGIAGNDSLGYIVQDRSIRTMQFLPGDNFVVFNISRVVKDRGCIGEFAFGTVGDILYFLAEDGFYSLAGSNLNPIGEDKVNRWWMQNSDPGRRNLVQCITTNRPYVVWAFYSNSATPVYDRAIIFNWAINRWTTASIAVQAWAMLATVPLDLDTTGNEPGDAFLDSNNPSPPPYWAPPPSGPPTPWPAGSLAPQPLDSFLYLGRRPLITGVDVNGRLGALTGPPLAATIETAEAHLVPGQRAFCSDVYPLGDSVNGLIEVSTRERLQDAPVWSQPIQLEVTGSASVTTSSRLHRFRYRTGAGDTWTNAQGVLAEAQPDGMA